jgi:hypothetical protein
MKTKKNNKYRKTGKGRKERKNKKGGTKNKTQKTHQKRVGTVLEKQQMKVKCAPKGNKEQKDSPRGTSFPFFLIPTSKKIKKRRKLRKNSYSQPGHTPYSQKQ